MGNLLEDLKNLDITSYDWSLALYTVSKSRDGIELEFMGLNIADINGWVEAVRSFTLEKTLSDKTVTDYNPVLPPECIGEVSKDDEAVAEPVSYLLHNIKCARLSSVDDFDKSPAGYAFAGAGRDGKIEAVFLRRTNPFVKGRLCVGTGSEVNALANPVLKFAQNADFILLNGTCYFVSAVFVKDLGLLDRESAVCERKLKAVEDKGLVSNYDKLLESSYNRKNTRKYLNFDERILEHISNMPIVERGEFLFEYGIELDKEGRVSTESAEECELLIDLLCCRSCLDPLGRLAVASNIVPRD